MLPLAYGGPSWSTNFGAPLRRSRIFPYRSIAAQRASVSGSLVGRLAFIGKSVRGRLTVSFHSGMGSQRTARPEGRAYELSANRPTGRSRLRANVQFYNEVTDGHCAPLRDAR